jgi:hypothetical protein
MDCAEAMRSPLNSPLEVGVRVLMLLSEAFPTRLDLNRLVLLDHGLLHSADLGGPESLHPPLPIRAGEFGMKRKIIEQGLEVMIRADLAELDAGANGIEFWASDRAYGFVNLLGSEYALQLHSRASWVIGHFEDLSDSSLRDQMRGIFDSWSEEFEAVDQSVNGG